MSKNKPTHWIISDPHYHHKNLVKGVSNWSNKGGCRPFRDIPSHNQTIVDGINGFVKEHDILWCLGDWSFGGIDKIWEFRKQINCKTIHFILGNHDHHIENNKTLLIPSKDRDEMIKLGLPLLPYHEAGKFKCYQLPAQQLFTSVDKRREVKIHGQRIVFSHYAMRVWNKSHHGTWMLHGHSHYSLPEYTSYFAGRPNEDEVFRTMDVGFEAAYDKLGEWRPFKFQEIQKMMAGRPKLQVDHHNENTTE